MRRIPPPTDLELDSRDGGPRAPLLMTMTGERSLAPVTKDTLKRVDEALRWHEQRAKERLK